MLARVIYANTLAGWRRGKELAHASRARCVAVQASKVYTNFRIQKEYKGAIEMEATPPTFSLRTSQLGGKYYQLDRPGGLTLSFAPAKAAPDVGYLWGQKIMVVMKTAELGEVLRVLKEEAHLFVIKREPLSNAFPAEAVSKEMRFGATPEGFEWTLMVERGKQATVITVPMSHGEGQVLQQLAAYLMPRLYGFDHQFEGTLETSPSQAT